MYNLITLKQMISRGGLPSAIELLSSKDLPSEIKTELAEFKVFDSTGKVNIPLLKTLV